MMSSGVSIDWLISWTTTACSRASFGGVDGRMLQNIGDDVQGQTDVLLEDLGVIGGMLARGIGVQMSAHRLDFLGDSLGRTALGAFEGHMLQQMRTRH